MFEIALIYFLFAGMNRYIRTVNNVNVQSFLCILNITAIIIVGFWIFMKYKTGLVPMDKKYDIANSSKKTETDKAKNERVNSVRKEKSDEDFRKSVEPSIKELKSFDLNDEQLFELTEEDSIDLKNEKIVDLDNFKFDKENSGKILKNKFFDTLEIYKPGFKNERFNNIVKKIKEKIKKYQPEFKYFIDKGKENEYISNMIQELIQKNNISISENNLKLFIDNLQEFTEKILKGGSQDT
jgi:hypothetical protein